MMDKITQAPTTDRTRVTHLMGVPRALQEAPGIPPQKDPPLRVPPHRDMA
jgi:hypothetical protein